jgi:hypothetical protein
MADDFDRRFRSYLSVIVKKVTHSLGISSFERVQSMGRQNCSHQPGEIS